MQTEYSQNGKSDTYEFFGIASTPEESLVESGMVMRNTRGDEYEVYFKVADLTYGWGIIYRSEIEDIIKGRSWVPEETVQKIVKSCGEKKETFLDLPIEFQIFTIRTILGHTNTFGKTIETYTFDEVLKTINSVDNPVEEEIEEEREETKIIKFESNN
jgi:hypothetical protein